MSDIYQVGMSETVLFLPTKVPWVSRLVSSLLFSCRLSDYLAVSHLIQGINFFSWVSNYEWPGMVVYVHKVAGIDLSDQVDRVSGRLDGVSGLELRCATYNPRSAA